ncbi:hypothetical protein WICMUC_003094 [Wickerhamomyces mucosus]|uniref:Uncharacterized protein n=1 Tax=Wickerhamomyces mucosus TaxID=1378264 RepID=A0A9P8PM72_9ASCO|nr:hypothetical protein WICMUC_003094 [Wickerhamomyces mucosus]
MVVVAVVVDLVAGLEMVLVDMVICQPMNCLLNPVAAADVVAVVVAVVVNMDLSQFADNIAARHIVEDHGVDQYSFEVDTAVVRIAVVDIAAVRIAAVEIVGIVVDEADVDVAEEVAAVKSIVGDVIADEVGVVVDDLGN